MFPQIVKSYRCRGVNLYSIIGPDEKRGAQAGLRIMLGGQPGDKGIDKMLNRLRETL